LEWESVSESGRRRESGGRREQVSGGREGRRKERAEGENWRGKTKRHRIRRDKDGRVGKKSGQGVYSTQRVVG